MKNENTEMEEEKDAIRKKIEKKAQKKEEMYKVKMEEDLPYEKLSKRAYEHYKEEKMKEINQEQIGEDLTFMSDLSLSKLNQSFAKLKRANSIYDDEEEKYEPVNEKSLMERKNDFIMQEEKIIQHENDEFEDKVNFGRPRAILFSILELKNDAEIQAKLNKLRNKFNIHNFLKKQGKKGNNLKHIGRRRSFLKFLEYTDKPDDFDQFLEENKDKDISEEENNIKNVKQKEEVKNRK